MAHSSEWLPPGSAGPLLLMLALAACGDGGAGTPPPELGTLAYVETQCRDTKELDFVERQALRIRQGEREPVTVFETPGVGPFFPGMGGLCKASTQGRFGEVAISREPFQAVTVSPDGTSVVFAVTDEFSVNPHLPLNLPEEQKGIFWVRADGTGLRRLGPPSRQRSFYTCGSGYYPPCIWAWPGLKFSPSGRTIAFVDKGPDADGYEADQVVTIDIATGKRTQVTRLPPALPGPGRPLNAPTAGLYFFIDDQTIAFLSSANPDGLNPDGTSRPMTITTGELHHLEVPLPIPIALPGSTIELRFVITGDRPQAILVPVPGEPINPGADQGILEVFVIDQGKNVLQLTSFRRADTWDPLLDVDREHVYFPAAADPLGTNPSENCQLFSIDRLGADLRQLTNFREREHSLTGCTFQGLGRGCAILLHAQDPRSRTLLFYSNCDPLGRNPNGVQIFAMQPDGSGLRQLTDSRGLVREADGTYSGELPGQWAYGPYLP